MRHEDRVTPQAVRDIASLPEKVRPAILEAIYASIADNPKRSGSELRFDLEGLFSARRGEYRIIYQIVPSARHVIILRVGHRRQVYRKR